MRPWLSWKLVTRSPTCRGKNMLNISRFMKNGIGFRNYKKTGGHEPLSILDRLPSLWRNGKSRC